MTSYASKTSTASQDVIGRQIEAERQAMIGPMPGRVTAYHSERGTVDVQPLFKKRKWDGSLLEYPELKEVPIDFVRGGNSAVTHPIPVGTRVMLTPMMRSGENYETEDDGSPSDRRSFNLSDMRASLAGGDSLSSPLPNVDPNNTHIRFDAEGQFGIKGSPDGRFQIDGSEGNLYDIIATFMELVASDELVINYGSSAGSGHRLFNRAALMELAAKVRAMAL